MMDDASFDQIGGQLRALLIRLDDRLSAEKSQLIGEFIDAGEFGLALEQIADDLSEAARSVTPEERADMLVLVDMMDMDGRVESALSLCETR